jgi:FkbM family methyltransferase
MSIVSAIPRVLLRRALAVIPDGLVVPILRGPLRGSRWITGALRHSCWLGGYEPERQLEFARLVREGDVVLDIGANVGFYTLLAARMVGPSGRVLAFEPLPDNLPVLRRHLAVNGLTNVDVIPAAVASRSGSRRFNTGEYPATGQLSELGGIEVDVVSLDDLRAAGRLSRVDLMKIDVEGAELEVLEGARAVLEEFRPVVIMELHNPEMDRKCPELLRSLGYHIEPVELWEDGVTARGGFSAWPHGSPRAPGIA